jgi:CheY-like chemotaxis protein/anti-sigma regulatory factor (Ser/Thr protein kinase)
MVELVNDLLDVARVEAGQIELHRRPVDLAEVVEEVARELGSRIAEKHQRLELEIDRTLPRSLADPARVRQIVSNLLTNAHLYTPEGGRLTLAVHGEDRAVAVSISDTGRGMTTAEAAHVFDRFYRADGESGAPGTGLGLSIVKTLVELHGGAIDVESAPGAGSTFRVRLPRALEPDSGLDASEAIRGKRVLVVDDEPAVAELIVAQLAPFAVEAEVVGRGEDALERLRSARFDAVTLDILLPGMSGFEVLRAIRSDPELRHTPVVIVSVFPGGQALHSEWAVSKPIEGDELTFALGAAVIAGRARVLVVGRSGAREQLRPMLERLGVPYQWSTNAAAAARLCEEHRFEAALVDAGLPDPEAVLQSIDLRGRRLRHAVVVFSTGDAGPGLVKIDPEPVPFETAVVEVLRALDAVTGEYA